MILNDFKHVIGGKLSVEGAELLRLFTKTGFPAAVRKVFYPHRLRKNMVDELGLRFAFLLGKL